MIKTIIFDIGGVLLYIEDSSNAIFRQLAKEFGIPEDKSMAFHAKYLDRMLVGKISTNAFFLLFKKEFHVKGNVKAAYEAAALKHSKPNGQLLKLIDKLSEHYPIVALSNGTAMRAIMDQHFDIYSHFNNVFLSYKLKMVKPSKRIYQEVLKKMKLKPEEVLFIDDKESNLKVARELGIKCIQFNNNAQLITEFSRIGLV